MAFDTTDHTTETVDYRRPLPRVSRTWQVVDGFSAFASVEHDEPRDELIAATRAANAERGREVWHTDADWHARQEIAASEGVRQLRCMKATGRGA